MGLISRLSNIQGPSKIRRKRGLAATIITTVTQVEGLPPGVGAATGVHRGPGTCAEQQETRSEEGELVDGDDGLAEVGRGAGAKRTAVEVRTVAMHGGVHFVGFR